MGVTRRYWGEVGLAAALAGLATLFGRPILLVGAAGVAGWTLARQYVFARTVSAAAADLSVEQSPNRDTVATDTEVEVTVRTELPYPAPVALRIEANPPAGIGVVAKEGSDDASETGHQRMSLARGEQSATATFTVRCPLAGEFDFGPPTVTATDEAGRFRASFQTGEASDLTVEARGPHDLHVGAGGEAIDAPYGEHDSERQGPGTDIADIRAYVPGDPVRRIDWNATARLDWPHIQEFETDTERRTVLLLDRRPSMGVGPDGATVFEYARQVALGVLRHAWERGDPIGLYEIGEDGLLAGREPTVDTDGYAALDRRLRAVEPQARSDERDRVTERETNATTRSPDGARQRTHRLRDDDSAFGDRLYPFFNDADTYVERLVDDPLYGVAQTQAGRLRGGVTTIVLTDDTRRTETREALKIARRRDDRAVTFLTPASLFEADGPADPKVAYERYADFEQFRRDLAALDRVTAFEVAPGDRLEAVLTADRDRRRRTEVGD